LAEALWVEEKITGGWFAQARMVVQGGRMVVAELRLSAISKTPPGGITQEVVRRVSLGSFGPYVLAAKSFVDTSPKNSPAGCRSGVSAPTCGPPSRASTRAARGVRSRPARGPAAPAGVTICSPPASPETTSRPSRTGRVLRSRILPKDGTNHSRGSGTWCIKRESGACSRAEEQAFAVGSSSRGPRSY